MTPPTSHVVGQPERPPWMVDRTISVSVLLTVLVWIAGSVWYIAEQNARLGTAEQRTISLEENARETRVSSAAKDQLSAINEKLARNEERLLWTLERLQIQPTPPPRPRQ